MRSPRDEGDVVRSMRRWRPQPLVAGLAGVLTVAAGCGGQASSPAAPPQQRERSASASASPASSSPSPTGSLAGVRATVIDTYLGMWHDYVDAARTQARDVEQLSQHAAGDAFEQLAGALAENRKENEVTRGDPQFHPKVVNLEPKKDPTRAKITDCADSSDWLQYDAKIGKRIKDQPAGRHQIRAVVSKVPSGGWKVTKLRIGEVGSC